MSETGLDEVVAGLHRFIESVVLPLESKHEALFENPRRLYDESGAMCAEAREVRRSVRMSSAEAGYYTLFASPELGGAGFGMMALYATWESLFHRYGPGRLLPFDTLGHWTSGPGLILENLSGQDSAMVVTEVMSGSKIMCFGMSEPDAGSDAWAMRTTADPDGPGRWRLNGTKQWTTNGPTADYILVFAVTDHERRKTKKGGITAFLVPMETPGVRLDSVVKLFGEIGGKEAIISFQDVIVDEHHLVGGLDDGMRLGLAGVGIGRIYNAARAVGLGRWALELAVRYANERVAFGSAIGENQGVAFPLAETAMELYAAATMAADCAVRLDRGLSAAKEMSMVKAFSTEACFRAFDRAIQVHGGMGLTNEMRLVDGLMQARIVRIADGTAEIMRRSIWQQLVKGNLAIRPLLTDEA